MAEKKSYTDVNPDTGRTHLAETPFPSAQRLAEYLRGHAQPGEYTITQGAPSLSIAASEEAYQKALDAYEQDTGTGKYAVKEKELREPRRPGEPSADDVPWEGYNDASSEDIIARLRGLDAPARERALAYERANRNRVTITRVNWNS